MKSLVGGAIAAVRNAAPAVPVSYASRGGAGLGVFRRATGQESQMRAMGAVGTLFAIVNRTSTALAAVDWHLWRTAASGKPEDRVEVIRHAALDVWSRPNPFYTRQEFCESEQQHIDLTGEGWWVIGRNPLFRSVPLELWPVRPDRMEPVPHPTEFLAGYVYTGPNGEKVPLELDEVIQIRMPNPLDPYRGMGPVQALLVDLDSTRYSAEWNRNFFLNGAEPGGIIEVPDMLSDTDFDQLRKHWQEQHQGVANAHRVAILESGKWVDRKFSQKDMQFAELASVSKATIREGFGMPKFAVGDVEDINRAAANASKAWFGEQITVPRLERFKQALNHNFLPMFGATAAGLEFDYESPVEGDSDAENAERLSKATAAKTYIDAGFTASSVVVALDLPASLEWEAPAPPPPALMPAPGVPLPPALPATPPAADTWAYLTAGIRGDTTPPTDLPDVSGLQDDWEAALAALLVQWDAVTRAQRAALVAAIRDILDAGNLTALAALSVDSRSAAGIIENAMLPVAAAAAARVVAEAAAQGVTITAAHAAADVLGQVAEVVAALLASDLSTSAARAALAAAGPDTAAEDVAAQVEAHLAGLTDANPRLQLGGALTGAQNAGRIETLRAAPEAAIYASEINDRNTCAPCNAVDGTWLGNSSDLSLIEKSYPGGAYGGYVHCLGGSRCRGTVVGVWRATQTGDQP